MRAQNVFGEFYDGAPTVTVVYVVVVENWTEGRAVHVEGVTKMVTIGGGLVDFVGAAGVLVRFDNVEVLIPLVLVDA